MRVGVSMGVSSASIGTGVQGTVCFRSRFSQDIWNKNMSTLFFKRNPNLQSDFHNL